MTGPAAILTAQHAALVALDAFWTASFPAGPDADDLSHGLGRLSSETIAIWKQARAAITLVTDAAAQPAKPDAYLLFDQGRRAVDDVEDYFRVALPDDTDDSEIQRFAKADRLKSLYAIDLTAIAGKPA